MCTDLETTGLTPSLVDKDLLTYDLGLKMASKSALREGDLTPEFVMHQHDSKSSEILLFVSSTLQKRELSPVRAEIIGVKLLTVLVTPCSCAVSVCTCVLLCHCQHDVSRTLTGGTSGHWQEVHNAGVHDDAGKGNHPSGPVGCHVHHLNPDAALVGR